MEEAKMTEPFDGGGFDMPDKIKRCGHHPDSGCTCNQESNEEYMRGKLEDRGYPGYPSTSQADEIMRKASGPSMYDVSHIPPPARLPTDPVVWVERLAEHIVEYRIENIPDSEQILEIMTAILPRAVELYLKKTKDYGGVSGGLGPKAPFVDMWRKMIKLKRSLWEGEELQFEQPSEVLRDMIGTVLNILVELPEHGIK
jgi:hypothetical protein